MTLGTSLRRARLLVSLGVVALLAAATSPASAESRYSLRGFGEPTFPWRADLRALAGAGSAASIPSIAGNPAAVGFLERGLFTGTYQTEWVSTKETLDDGATRDRTPHRTHAQPRSRSAASVATCFSRSSPRRGSAVLSPGQRPGLKGYSIIRSP